MISLELVGRHGPCGLDDDRQPRWPTLDPVWAARGLLAFAAFTEAAAGLRCLLPAPKEAPAYVRQVLFVGAELGPTGGDAERLVGHLYALVCWWQALALTAAAVASHLSPVILVASGGVTAKILFLLIHILALNFVSVDNNAAIFPVVASVAASFALVTLWLCRPEETLQGDRGGHGKDENDDLLRAARFPRKLKSFPTSPSHAKKTQ